MTVRKDGDINTMALRKSYAAGESWTADQWAAVTNGECRDVRTLIELHDLMLFVKAFPHDHKDRGRVERGLTRLSAVATRMAEARASDRRKLLGSGIAGMSMRAGFSIDLCRWLLEVDPGALRLDALEGDEEQVRNVMLVLAQPVEREAMDDARYDVADRLSAASGGQHLRWLVQAIDRSTSDPFLRHVLWEVCSPKVVLSHSHPSLSRTFGRGLDDPIHPFPKGTRDLGDVRAAIDRAMTPDPRSTSKERASLLTAARGVLIAHRRETDPVTYGDPKGLSYHRMDHGIGVLLLSLPPERRTAFDAYVGYVAFVNNVPVAYGGAWLFPGKTKVGINVFPAFRGGPSAMIYAQILRCYAQRFGVGCFEAENYQLGYGNSDGIRSGAYWFYYRLGFRTQHKRSAELAEREWKRMRDEPGHRTPAPVLRRLAAEPMHLLLHDENAPLFEPLDLSEKVLQHLATECSGDRGAARERIVQRVGKALNVTKDERKWPEQERRAFGDLAPAMDLIPDLGEWPATQKRRLVELMRAKGALTEDRYIARLRKHPGLLRAWADLVGQ